MPYLTLDEPWTHTLDGEYAAAHAFALATLGPGHGRPLLVIGSPLAEAIALAQVGWQTTFIDWRMAPLLASARVFQGDATALPFPDHTFAAVSSTCVLCHVGMGRYGDPVYPDGPVRMLREIARVLGFGGRAALMVGPVGEVPVELPEHRVTTRAQVAGWAIEAGLTLTDWTLAGPEGYGCVGLERAA